MERVSRARELQRDRYRRAEGVFCNGDLPSVQVSRWVPLDRKARDLLEDVHGRLGLSARGYHRLVRVARTIADLEAAPEVAREHLLEATRYRDAFGNLNGDLG